MDTEWEELNAGPGLLPLGSKQGGLRVAKRPSGPKRNGRCGAEAPPASTAGTETWTDPGGSHRREGRPVHHSCGAGARRGA